MCPKRAWVGISYSGRKPFFSSWSLRQDCLDPTDHTWVPHASRILTLLQQASRTAQGAERGPAKAPALEGLP